jgi:hypothetical protein
MSGLFKNLFQMAISESRTLILLFLLMLENFFKNNYYFQKS